MDGTGDKLSAPIERGLRIPASSHEELRGFPDPLKEKRDDTPSKVDIDLSQSTSVVIRRKKRKAKTTRI